MSDPLGLTAQPIPYCPNTPEFITSIKKLCDEYEVQLLILGLPIAMSGKETEKSIEARALALQLEAELKLPVLLKDERLSTSAVTRHLIAADIRRNKRKEIIDSQAAAFILQGYLDQVKK